MTLRPETFQDPILASIAAKVINQEPVDETDARYLLSTTSILELGTLAHFVRTRLHGPTTCYGVNMNLNYTNICELRCPLCAYSCNAGDDQAFVLSLDDIEQRVEDGVKAGIDEVHIVGGLNPELTIDYFEEMLHRIKRIKPDIFIVGFTAVEYDYFSRMNRISLEKVFQRLIAAGVNALPGGGAEIFSEGVRATIAPKKIPGSRWLEVMATAHRFGLKTNATMLYNHIEDVDDLVDHLFRIRRLQDETGGFKTFVPLLFHEEHTKVRARRPATTGFEDVRIYAASRIILHNVPHIKALWMYLGEKMAQVLLRFGADELGGTYINEQVVHAAGASTPVSGAEAHLRRLIEAADLVPKRTTAGYQKS